LVYNFLIDGLSSLVLRNKNKTELVHRGVMAKVIAAKNNNTLVFILKLVYGLNIGYYLIANSLKKKDYNSKNKSLIISCILTEGLY